MLKRVPFPRLQLNDFTLSEKHTDNYGLLRLQQPTAFYEVYMTDYALFSDERLDIVNEKITVIQKKDGLTFGTDAFLLASFIRQQKNSSAVELGTGTGIISLLCAAKEKFKFISALEIQDDFFSIAERNTALNGLNSSVKVIKADIREISAADIGKEVDVVFSNPPYMSTESGKRNISDRKYIARHEVCGNIDDFCSAAFRLLKHGGKFYCVWRPDRLSSLMHALKSNRLEPKTACFVHADCSSEPSMVLISALKGGAEGLKILPPLLLHEAETASNKSRELTERAKKIYETMSFGE